MDSYVRNVYVGYVVLCQIAIARVGAVGPMHAQPQWWNNEAMIR